MYHPPLGSRVGGHAAPRPGGGEGHLEDARTSSTDPTWAEVFRRVCVPYYEEARHLFDKARMGGWEVIPEKLSVEKLMGIINAFTR